MKFIKTNNAPEAIGPYSQAVEVNNMIFISGQLPLDPITMEASSDIQVQTEQALSNILSILKSVGLDKDAIVRCGVFMTDLSQFAEMNEVYSNFFETHKPARAAVQVSRLPKDVMIEIDAIAVRK